MSGLNFQEEQVNNFKAYTETQKEATAKKPDCIRVLLPPNYRRAELSDEEVWEAQKRIWNNKFMDLKFPRERKLRDDPPIANQTVGIVSFIPSPSARPDRQGCYGVLKLRGNFPSQTDAERYGEMLMRQYDSYADYDLVRVGQEFPLMIDNSIYTEENVEINLKAQMDDITKSVVRKKKLEERQQQREVEERQRRLLSKNTSYEKDEAIDDLEYYVSLRTRKAALQQSLDEGKKKLKEALDALAAVSKDVVKLESSHPEYKEEYLAKYEQAMRSIGADKDEMPLLKYMKDHDEGKSTPISAETSIESLIETEEEKTPIVNVNKPNYSTSLSSSSN